VLSVCRSDLLSRKVYKKNIWRSDNAHRLVPHLFFKMSAELVEHLDVLRIAAMLEACSGHIKYCDNVVQQLQDMDFYSIKQSLNEMTREFHDISTNSVTCNDELLRSIYAVISSISERLTALQTITARQVSKLGGRPAGISSGSEVSSSDETDSVNTHYEENTDEDSS